MVFTKPDQERRVSELREAFEESSLPFRVDLFVWDAVPEQFRKQIEADHAVLVEKEERGAGGDGWVALHLGDVCTKIGSGATPRGGKEVYLKDGPCVLIRSQNVHNNQFHHDGLAFIDEQQANELNNVEVFADDVLLNITGDSVARACQVVPDVLPSRVNQHVAIIRPDPNKLSPHFLRYFLVCPEIQAMLLSWAGSGGTRNALTKGMIESFEVQAPMDVAEQRAIAHILGTLDDKIELNRRMNETLETMARALFKSWFVDFDPVRAKAALRNHSPLEGESVRQGRSPQPSRWGEIDGETKWGAIKRFYTQQTLQKAQTLRESQTNAEGLLWHYLRDKQLAGHKFRRQQPIGPYIVDFACMPKKLLIELDGGQHAEQHTYDKKRDEFLRGKGYKILRFWNNDVFENCFGVLESIRAAVQDPPPQQSAPNGLTTETPPQGGSDWSVERARAYLDRMPQHLADLFPDRLVDSELGPVPEEWEVSTIGQEVDVVGGSTPSTKDPSFWNGTINWATPKDLSSLKSPVLVETSRKITEKGLDKIGSGLLPRGTVLLSSRAPIGYLVISDVPVAIKQGFIAMKCQNRLSATYVWLWAAANMAAILENANGSTFQEISKSNFRPLSVIVPNVSIRKIHDKLMQMLYDRVVKNERQSCTLAALRDTLLPRLISGELAVKDAEKFIGRVV